MARPQPVILADNQQEPRYQVLAATTAYIITFQGQPCSVRSLQYQFPTGEVKKYMKMSYTHLSSCLRQIKILNERFNTTEFGYIQWPQ